MKEISDSTWNNELSSAEVAVVDVWATWCGPCLAFSEIIEAVAEANPQSVFLKANLDDNMKHAYEYSVSAIPTLLVFSQGQLIGRRSGAYSYTDTSAWLDQVTRSEGNVHTSIE